ncbi:hypothetical protein [Synechococcus sp. PCC 7336]|uniref:hypothetical protein n=1 Tax=Synechococcus sp. PCC 7336 TaxID=195250 RepID=UPI0003495464|nr:hypothetical protein [Synechococcus sp. PCC 7336]
MLPIPAPANPLQYRALGFVKGQLVPAQGYAQATLVTEDGSEHPATPARVELLEKFNHCVETERSYWFYVHPQPRGDVMGFGIVKIATDPAQEPEDGFLPAPEEAEAGFNLRGNVSAQGDKLVVSIHRKPSGPRTFPPLKIPIEGFLAGVEEEQFWDLWAEPEGQSLVLVDGQKVS